MDVKNKMDAWFLKDRVDALKAPGKWFEGGEDTQEHPALVMLKVEMGILEKMKCPDCDGFGHEAEDCPTRDRILLLCQGNKGIANVIARARKYMAREIIVANLGKRRCYA